MSDWISVDERLPEDEAWVLVTVSVKGINDEIVTMALFHKSEYQGKDEIYWLTNNDTNSGEIKDVIGWKPLPKPMNKPQAEFNTKQEG